MKTDTIFKLIIICLFIGSIVMTGFALIKMEQGCKSCEMRFNNTKMDGVRGVWTLSDDEEYMCVGLEGRSDKEIEDTICHECDHHYVYDNPQHYCEGYEEFLK